MSKRLLDRQTSLLEHLASGAVIFGDQVDTPEGLDGIDGGLLHLEARFCNDKRMGKVAAIIPRTLALLGGHRTAIFRRFVEMYPPAHIGRLENARQFCKFLCDGRRVAQELPYVGDVAACELACAEVRHVAGSLRYEAAGEPEAWSAIRRSPTAVLLRCSYDVRCFFEGNLKGDAAAVPPQRETLLIAAWSPGARQAQIFEVIAPVFELAAALDDWVDPAALCLGPEAGALIADLERQGLIEARR
jgi:hypothetical protein